MLETMIQVQRQAMVEGATEKVREDNDRFTELMGVESIVGIG